MRVLALCIASAISIASLAGCNGGSKDKPPPPEAQAPSVAAQNPASTQPGMVARPQSSEEIAKLRARVKDSPKDEEARVRLAALLDSQGNGSEAEDVLRAALQSGQRTAGIYRAIGTLYLQHEQFRPARDAFRYVVKLDPKDAQGHLRLASSYSYLQQGKEAEKEYFAALKIDPGLADAYLGLAFVNNTSERYPFAIKYLNEYSKHAGQPGPGLALLSRVYLNMRMYEKAVESGVK